jgi:hypothetical protein
MYINRKEAIDAHCKGCIYDSQVKGRWRAQVEACEMNDCPLYEFRPKTISTANKESLNEANLNEIETKLSQDLSKAIKELEPSTLLKANVSVEEVTL